DVLQALRLKAPVLTHIRELSDVLAALDPARRRVAMEGSAAFAVVSQPVQDVLSTEYGIDPAAVMLEPPALDLSEVLGKAAAPHEQTTLDRFDNRPYVCGVGSLISRKGPDLFLKMAALASAAGSPLNFIWAGAGDMHAELLAETQALGLTETVHWLGQVANPYPLLRGAVALALTSREDPHPRTMVEAATLGTPTVAFAGTGGADHFLATYSAGLCVAAYDLKAFHAALLGQQGQRVCVEPVHRQFDIENSAERLFQSLKALVA
ncbi:MAG: glycosyltransferase, partial [Pseudomonadota bacterium]